MTMSSDTQYRHINYRHDTVKSMEAVREEPELGFDRQALKIRLYEEFNCCGDSCDDAFQLALDMSQDNGEEAVRDTFQQLVSLFLPGG